MIASLGGPSLHDAGLWARATVRAHSG